MDDLISRQAAIEAIKEDKIDLTDPNVVAVFKATGDFEKVETQVMTCDRLIKILKDLPSAQRWIPCDKGEPDEDMECWVTVKTTDALYRGNFTKRYGERRDKGFITSGGFMWWNTALAWMPIYEPEPYRPEGDYKHEG